MLRFKNVNQFMKKSIILAIMIMTMSITACKNSNKQAQETSPATEVEQVVEPFQSVDVATFKLALADSSNVVLDVRTAKEHEEGFIPGTVFNFDVLEEGFIDEVKAQIPEGATVAIYCRSGNRSKKAADLLVQNGYQVIELATGYKGWKAAEEQ